MEQFFKQTTVEWVSKFKFGKEIGYVVKRKNYLAVITHPQDTAKFGKGVRIIGKFADAGSAMQTIIDWFALGGDANEN